MEEKQHRKASTPRTQINDERQLIFKTPGAITTKYSVVIETDSQRHVYHHAGLHSPAEALWLALVEYFLSSHSDTAITGILVFGYAQTKKERQLGVAHWFLHFPKLPTSK